jgi:hypothetical protein
LASIANRWCTIDGLAATSGALAASDERVAVEMNHAIELEAAESALVVGSLDGSWSVCE